MDLPTAWLTAGSNKKLWGEGGTYKTIACDALPPLAGPLDGSFAWLAAARSRPYGMSFEHMEDEPIAELIAERVVEAKCAGLVIPPEFTRFMTDETLFTRIPSCTACYWDLGARLMPIPEHDGPERLLRFMNDQQACALWYLLLAPDGSHQVAFAWPDWSEDEAGGGDSLEDCAVPRDVTICAPSFEAFIKRFWIENTLWDTVHRGDELMGELRDYVEAVERAVTSGLVER